MKLTEKIIKFFDRLTNENSRDTEDVRDTINSIIKKESENMSSMSSSISTSDEQKAICGLLEGLEITFTYGAGDFNIKSKIGNLTIKHNGGSINLDNIPNINTLVQSFITK